MKLALLKGNRFNPWHLQAFDGLGDDVDVTAFRADSQVQAYFKDRDDGELGFTYETIAFDTQAGPALQRVSNKIKERYTGYEPRIVPFADRLAGFDVIQSWELFTDWTEQALDARRDNGTPVSLMVWDTIPFNNEDTERRVKMKRRAVNEADAFLVHTEWSRRVLELEGVSAEKVTLVPPGVDETHFCPGSGERAAFGLDEDEFVILFVGWLLPRKGLDYLILALRELVSDSDMKDVRFRLAVVGEGPGKDRIDALLRRTELEDRCTFLDTFPYSKMPEVYNCADVFVLPSITVPGWQEQFGMSLLEAMSCGVPVVTTQSGAIPEIAGDATDLCPPNDFIGLAKCLKSLVLDTDRRQERGSAGRKRVETNFSLDGYVTSLKRHFRKLVS